MHLRILTIHTQKEAYQELREVGVDPSAVVSFKGEEEFSSPSNLKLETPIQDGPFLLKFRKGVLNLSTRTHIMGAINVTPDSFYDGGLYLEPQKAIDRALKLEDEGADIIDIGGESTRPGAEPVSAEEELRRVMPVVEGLVGRLSVPISIDTYKSQTAEMALSAGAGMVNDISGLTFDPKLAEVVAAHQVPLILGHIKGRPKDMQVMPHYSSLISEIWQTLNSSIERAVEGGVVRDNIVIDPGIGFGKTVAHNFLILKNLSQFKTLHRPICLGPSRKSFIYKTLGTTPEGSLEGTLAAVTVAIMNGAHIIRTHDVAATKRAAMIADGIIRSLGEIS